MRTMKRTNTVKPAANELYVGELEFSQSADVLIEAIRQRHQRLNGKAISDKELLKVANQVLESRV